MLRSLVINNFVEYAPFSVFYQCVRWSTKPRWVPVAKSKLFRIPERKKIPEEEKIEIMRLYNNYRTQIHSIRRYLSEEVVKTTSLNKVAQVEAMTEQEEHLKCIQENDAWNARIALIREARLAEQAKTDKEKILNAMIAREQREQEELKKIEQIVIEEKLKAHTFITADNIDQAIEEALANSVDPNFAIDLDGNLYRGRYTQPDSVPEEQREKIQSSSSS